MPAGRRTTTRRSATTRRSRCSALIPLATAWTQSPVWLAACINAVVRVSARRLPGASGWCSAPLRRDCPGAEGDEWRARRIAGARPGHAVRGRHRCRALPGRTSVRARLRLRRRRSEYASRADRDGTMLVAEPGDPPGSATSIVPSGPPGGVSLRRRRRRSRARATRCAPGAATSMPSPNGMTGSSTSETTRPRIGVAGSA